MGSSRSTLPNVPKCLNCRMVIVDEAKDFCWGCFGHVCAACAAEGAQPWTLARVRAQDAQAGYTHPVEYHRC